MEDERPSIKIFMNAARRRGLEAGSEATGGPAIKKGNGLKTRTTRTGCIGHPRCARILSEGTRYCSCIKQYRRDVRLSDRTNTTTRQGGTQGGGQRGGQGGGRGARSYQQPPVTAEEWSLAFCRRHPFCSLMRPAAAGRTTRRRTRRCSCNRYLAAATLAAAGKKTYPARRHTALAASQASWYRRWRQMSRGSE